MKSLSVCAVALVLALGAVSARATLDLYEDFEAYTVDTSINLVGDDGGYPRWASQANRSEIMDSNHAYVRNLDGSQVLELVNRDADDGIDTVYTAMAFGSKAITGQGTVYMQFKASGPNDDMVGLNGLASGWEDGGEQGHADNYNLQAPIWRMSGGEEFRARATLGSYANVDMGQEADVWQEMWVQIDVANERTKYYLCPEGGAPTVVMNPLTGDEYWVHRTNYDYIFNLKFFIGNYEGGTVETTLLVDNIAIDNTGFSTDGVWNDTFDGHTTWPPSILGDANCDDVVDIDDFVALKNGFGSGSTWGEGDFNGDGVVNIDDFVILKNHFGDTAVPEPATMSLLALGGVALVRRRR